MSTDSQLVGKDMLDGFVLAIGLFLRDVRVVQFIEPGEDTTHLPVYISGSHLELQDQHVVLQTCDNIRELIEAIADTGR